MKRWKLTVRILLASTAACLLCCTPAEAKKGGGGATYTILDLPGPYHQDDGESSWCLAEKISDPSASGFVYVLGRFDRGNGSQLCVWTVDAAGGVEADDISGALDWGQDINSDGIIAGKADNRPALLLGDGTTVKYLDADPDVTGDVRGLNMLSGTSIASI